MADGIAEQDLKLVEDLQIAYRQMKEELEKVIIGQSEVIEELLVALFSRGHCLIVGVPGLAKTLLVRTLAQLLDLKFKRIQFTPDLMPSDIIGTEVIQEDPNTGRRLLEFMHGPIFANVILADEINRTPPKTQAALLEAMQEYRVTVGNATYALSPPFFVLATQNPIEHEGTYPLPEAQLDRFMFNILIDYPDEEHEREVVRSTTFDYEPDIQPLLEADQILTLQQVVRRVPVSDHVLNYAVNLVRSTRPLGSSLEFIRSWVQWGAGPRAAQYMVVGAKARAIMHGRYNVSCKDVTAVASSILRHRVILNFNAEAEGVTVEDVIARLIREAPERAS